MLERIKTVVLILLVGTSFYLTYNLWWDNRTFEPLIAMEYEEPQKIGFQKSWTELIQPSEIYFHYAGNRHTKATQETSIYRMVWEAMQRWQFTDAQDTQLSVEQGRELLEERNGLEFVFTDEYPVQFYTDLMHLPDSLTTKMETFNRVWVYEISAMQGYKVLFISDAKHKVMEADLIDVDRAKGFGVNSLMMLGSHLIEQQTAQAANAVGSSFGVQIDFYNLIYLPVERTDMNQWTYTIGTTDIDEMSNALFLDMTAMKEISERGGSQIFTDGTKSLQYKESTKDMRFYLPLYEQGAATMGDADFYPALDFMNHHYGWTGDYRVWGWQGDQDVKGIEFREHISGYPVYSDNGSNFGRIMLKYQFNQVNEYTRNLVRLETSNSGYQIKIKSGAELLMELRAKSIYLYNFKQIELGYKAVMNMESLEAELIPHYIIHFYSNREPMLIDARVQNMEGT